MSNRRCPECGAPWETDEKCVDCFHALLAFENERPAAFGAVHHLTVACYYLQHPTGYTEEVLAMWLALIADALDGRATVRELRARSGRRFGGSRRVRDQGAKVPAWWPRQWPMTVHDVLRPSETLPSVEVYIDRGRRWAAETRKQLDQASGVEEARDPSWLRSSG